MAATTFTRTDRVLAAARDNHRATTDLEIGRLLLAVEWAELHPGEEPDPTDWACHPVEIAGDGAPWVDESAAAEFALAIGMKHEPGIRYLGDAVELHYRLPKIWRRVVAGEVPVWKARKVAQATRSLSFAAAAAVDKHLALIVKRCSFAEIDRQVDRARSEHDPEETERRRLAAADCRHASFDWRHVTSTGFVHLEAWLDIADALTLDDTLATKAAELDPALPLDVRRAIALGSLGTHTSGESGSTTREVVIYTHARPDATMVEVDNTRSVVTPDQVREWCAEAGTKVTIRPVIDLNQDMSSTAYEAPPLLREQVILRYRHCLFPDCEHPSRSCDLDHRIPYDAGGPTESSNLYPLCRKHHRLKTTGGWTYQLLDPHTVEWTSPRGWRYRRRIS